MQKLAEIGLKQSISARVCVFPLGFSLNCHQNARSELVRINDVADEHVLSVVRSAFAAKNIYHLSLTGNLILI